MGACAGTVVRSSATCLLPQPHPGEAGSRSRLECCLARISGAAKAEGETGGQAAGAGCGASVQRASRADSEGTAADHHSHRSSKLQVYSDGSEVTETLLATGVSGHPTQVGVFSIIQKVFGTVIEPNKASE